MPCGLITADHLICPIGVICRIIAIEIRSSSGKTTLGRN
jgi:hypothetical protein